MLVRLQGAMLLPPARQGSGDPLPNGAEGRREWSPFKAAPEGVQVVSRSGVRLGGRRTDGLLYLGMCCIPLPSEAERLLL